MKKLILLIFACCALTVQAQDPANVTDAKAVRFAYLSYEQALKAMPGYEMEQRRLDALRQQYDAEAKRSADDFNRKYEEFLEGRRDFPPTILRKRQMELQELMERNIAFKEQGRRELAHAEDSLMQPLRQKLDQVVARIGQERGYALIVNTDANACPYINPEMGEDISTLVAVRLRD